MWRGLEERGDASGTCKTRAGRSRAARREGETRRRVFSPKKLRPRTSRTQSMVDASTTKAEHPPPLRRSTSTRPNLSRKAKRDVSLREDVSAGSGCTGTMLLTEISRLLGKTLKRKTRRQSRRQSRKRTPKRLTSSIRTKTQRSSTGCTTLSHSSTHRRSTALPTATGL